MTGEQSLGGYTVNKPLLLLLLLLLCVQNKCNRFARKQFVPVRFLENSVYFFVTMAFVNPKP